MGTKKQADVELVGVEDRTLAVKLTEEERRAYAMESATLVGQIEQEEIAEAGRKKQVKEGIDGLRSHLRLLAEKVRTGEELRKTPCDILHDYSKVERRVVRQDTWATVESRTLRAEEIQTRLPGTEE